MNEWMNITFCGIQQQKVKKEELITSAKKNFSIQNFPGKGRWQGDNHFP